jgi:isoleucyl-tRNA synthetase
VLKCRACGAPYADAGVCRHVAGIFAAEGSNAWFVRDAAALVPPDAACPACGGKEFDKEFNILDVWFESGASQNVLERESGHAWPADVYIEGHDQHRGWFNSSLLIGVGAKGGSPFRTCITHGFILDDQGRAMSKSLGNVIDPGEVIKRSGAEIVRLWAAMLNYKEDARFGTEIEQRLVEAYRKLRNTWRFLLGNVSDFEPGRDTVAEANFLDLDRFILLRFDEVRARVVKAYEDCEFHPILHAVLDFFTVDLSAFYLDVVKDRAYCSGKGSLERRSAQTAMFTILRDSLLLMAPILSFTADEAWAHVPAFTGKDDSVHLGEFPKAEDWLGARGAAFVDDMERLLGFREKVLKELEKAREAKLIGNSLESSVSLKAPAADATFLEVRKDDLATLFIVSAVAVEKGAGDDLVIEVAKAPGGKCERCWNFSTHVGTSPDHPTFCARCEKVVKASRP